MTNIVRHQTGAGMPLMPISELLSYAGPHNASTHAPDVSEKYNFISTVEVLKALDGKGFGVANFQRNRVRTGPDGFQKHMIKLQHTDSVGLLEAPQVILINSHNRSSGFRIMAGMFRLVCSNGLVVGNDLGFSVRHVGGNANQVIDAVYRVVENTAQIAARIDAFKSVQLTSSDQMELANRALLLRFDAGKAPFRAERALQVNRSEDIGNDLWSTFNRVQENLSGRKVRGLNSVNGRRITVQPLKAIDSNIQFNQKLWSLAEQFATGKVA